MVAKFNIKNFSHVFYSMISSFGKVLPDTFGQRLYLLRSRFFS